MLVPPQGRNAAARHVVDACLRIASGNADPVATVRGSIERCRAVAVRRGDLVAVDAYTAQLADLALRDV